LFQKAHLKNHLSWIRIVVLKESNKNLFILKNYIFINY
jgi:hypothetical protein